MTTSAAAATVHAGVPPHFTEITVSAAVVSLTMALLLCWRPLGRLNFLVPWLCLIGGIGLAAAFLRQWAHSLSGLGATLPYVGVAAPVVVAVVLFFIVGYDLWPGHSTNRTTYMSAVLLPAFAPELGGAAGSTLATFLGWVAVAGATTLGRLFGV